MDLEGQGLVACSGQVTFVTGPTKQCGKTTFMNRAMQLARRDCAARGLAPPAMLTAGYDGEVRDYISGARKTVVPVCAGDIFVTAQSSLATGGGCPELLDLVPGCTALGCLCIVRATRDGTATLVGPEGNTSIAWVLERLVGGGLTSTVLVDGAFNRITPVASWSGSRFVYVMQITPASLRAGLDSIRRLGILLDLPVRTALPGSTQSTAASSQGMPLPVTQSWSLDGPLTARTAASLPQAVQHVVIDDFTKVFLDYSELLAFVRGHSLSVRRKIGFGGFVVSCRGIGEDRFLATLADDRLAGFVIFNPYRAAAASPEARTGSNGSNLIGGAR
jgi:hypothetical protein